MGLGLVVAALFLFSALLARADDLIVSNQTPAFALDTRLPSTDPGPGSLIVQFESPPFTLDTRLPDGVAPSSGTVVTESGSFILDTRLPDGVAPSSGTVVVESSPFTLDTRLPDGISFTNGVVIAESPPFTLDTRLPADTTPPAAMVVTVESPLFTLDTRLPGDTAPLPNLITQTESAPFTLDTRIALQDPLNTNLLGMAQSDPFTLDTLSGAYTTPAQTLSGGTTGGRARFSPDGLQLAKADGSRVLLWNLHSIRTNVTFTGYAGEVTTVEFSPLGDQLLTGSADGTFRWWDTASRNELGHTNPPGNGTVYAAYASDGARILAGRGANAALYRVPSMQLMQQFPGSEGTISAVAVCPEGLALAGNSYRSAILWDTATGAVRSHLTNHTRMITAAAFFPGGTNAMTASLDGTIRIWDTATGTECLRIQAGTQVGDAALSLDGRLIASCDTGNPGTASLWDAQSGALLRIFTDTGSEASQIKCVALSPDQTALATTHVDGSVRLWNTGLDPRPIYPVTPLPIGTNALVTLRSHGLYYFAVDAQAARSLVITLEADTSGGSAKLKGSADIPVGLGRALSTDAEFANLGATQADRNVGAPTSKSLQSPPPSADIAAFRMTASRSKLPSQYDYEYFAQAPVTNLHCEMPVATTTSDKVYVLVFAPYLSAGGINARIRAEFSDFHLSSVAPARGGNSGNVTVCLQGTGLSPDATARLTGAGGTVASCSVTLWADSTKAWFTFPLNGVAAGTYNVEVSKPGGISSSLPNAFQVGGRVGPQLQSQLSAPSAVRPSRDYSMTVEYANVGDVDMAAPLFVVSTTWEGKRWLYYYAWPGYYGLLKSANKSLAAPGGNLPIEDQNSEKTSPMKLTLAIWPHYPPNGFQNYQKTSQMQTLGLNFDGPPGILPPGSRQQIQVYFQADPNENLMSFDLSVLKADATPIDWAALEPKFRAAVNTASAYSSAAWPYIWNNFKSSIGSTWADYLHALDAQAQVLLLSGQPSYNAADLLAAAFSEAAGTSHRRTLAAAVDAQAPAPGLPLQFARFVTDSIEQRFQTNQLFGTRPLGRGWAHNFQYELELSWPCFDCPFRQSSALIRMPGGAVRRFSQQSDGSWQGSAGDYGTLASITGSNASWKLREKDGTVMTFDNVVRLASIEDPNGNRLSFEYGPSGGLSFRDLIRIVHSSGPSLMLIYNAQHRVSRLVDHAGQVTAYEYDASGEYLLRVISPGGVTNSYTYQPATGSAADHALTSVTFPDNTHQYFEWNVQGRLAGQYRDGGAELQQFDYAPGGLMTVRDANKAATTLRFGTRGQVVQVNDPLGRIATFDYDGDYNPVRVAGPAGETSELQYNASGNATNLINPLGQEIRLGYTGLDRLGFLRDARGQTTGFDYDSGGNLTGIAYPDTSAERFAYDTTGSLTTYRNRRGQAIQYFLNPQGQITQKLYPDGRTVNYGYDPRGYLTNVTDSAQGTTSMGYDTRGLLTGIAYPDSKGFTFEYNAAGRRTRRVGHDGYTLNYGYDAVGRLASLTEGTTNELVRYTYDAAGQLSREDKGNRTFTTYTYDPAGQIVALTNHAPGGVAQSFFNYTYDAKGNRLSMTTTAGETSYEYDPLSQLTGVTYPGGRRVTYAYDAAGNRIVVSDNGTNTVYTANALNQYTQAGAAVFGYDADGNMTSRTDGTGTTSYEYDIENRLVGVATPTNGVFQYTYDALGNRTAVTHDGITSRYLHDPVGLVDVAVEYGGGGALLTRYDYALGLVARSDLTSTAFYSFDALGNTREITGNAGTLNNSYDYDTFGAETENETLPNSFTFAGRFGVVREPSALHFMRGRYYDSRSGRFLSADPSGLNGGDENLYRYVLNDPVNGIDPLGADTVKISWPNGLLYVFGWDPRTGHTYLGLGYSRSLGSSTYVTRDNKTGWVSGFGVGLTGKGGFSYSKSSPKGGVFFDGRLSALGLVLKGTQYLGSPGTLEGGLAPITQRMQGQSANLQGGYIIDLCKLSPDTCDLAGIYGPLLKSILNRIMEVVRPRDPNDKIGPTGVGPNRVVSTNDFMEYMVRFENMAAATAPVQELIVVDYLDASLDWTTVEFEEIAYGDRLLAAPAHSQSFTLRDLPPTNSPSITGSSLTNLAVNISAMFNPQAGRLECRMTAVDTNTGIWPLDALAGFLPPENGSGRGQGHVKFRVKPKAATPFGTAITNTATIVFDGNEAIATPAVWNIVGDVPSLTTTIAYLPGQILAGKPFTYSLAITNTGASAVTNVVVTNTLPDGFNLVSNYVTIGTVTQTNGILTWIIDSLTNGVDARWFITVLPINAGTFTNNISYSGGSGLAIFNSPGVITVLPSVPSLGIRMNNGQVELYWQTNFTGFHVQRTSSLSTSNRWVDLTNAPVIVGQEYRVTNGPPVGTQFYRLSGTLASSVAQPVIGIQVVGTQIQLSWPTNASAFHLQSAAPIAPAVWSDVTNVPAAAGGFYRVNVNASGTSRYFRLLKP